MHEELAVRHAAVALSALQMLKYKDTPHSSRKLAEPFTLEQYDKSVNALRKLFGNPDFRSVNAALVCSILCISFEVLNGSHELAQQHLESGLQVVVSNCGIWPCLLCLLQLRCN